MSVGEGVGVDVGAGVGVDVGAGVHSELHVGYAVRSVDPQLSYTPRLMQSARPELSNTEVYVVTRSTFHDAMFALNADAELKVEDSVVTPATFQPPMGWLKAAAEEKVEYSVVTDATFQLARF